jgi:hypothetical protein
LSLSHAGDVSLHVYRADDGEVSAVLKTPLLQPVDRLTRFFQVLVI